MTAPVNRRMWLAQGGASLAAMPALALAASCFAEAEGAAPADGQVHPFTKAPRQEFPWGWIRWVMNAEIDAASTLTVGIVHIEPGQSNTLHVHSNCDEVLHVISGRCEHRLGDEWVSLVAGDTLRIPQGERHMARTKDTACRVIVVYNTGTRQMTPLSS